MITLTNEQLELDDDKLEIQSTLREWGWKEEHINIILEKYYDDFPSFDSPDLVSAYLEFVSVEENFDQNNIEEEFGDNYVR